MKLQDSDDLETRIIKTFLDVLILKYLKKSPFNSGYQILQYLHDVLNMSFSPATVYHAIYLLERKNLIKCHGDENGRIYALTDQGERSLKSTADSSIKIQNLVHSILSEHK
jgi:DNA-binding PadR family transcriptional regulator